MLSLQRNSRSTTGLSLLRAYSHACINKYEWLCLHALALCDCSSSFKKAKLVEQGELLFTETVTLNRKPLKSCASVTYSIPRLKNCSDNYMHCFNCAVWLPRDWPNWTSAHMQPRPQSGTEQQPKHSCHTLKVSNSQPLTAIPASHPTLPSVWQVEERMVLGGRKRYGR